MKKILIIAICILLFPAAVFSEIEVKQRLMPYDSRNEFSGYTYKDNKLYVWFDTITETIVYRLDGVMLVEAARGKRGYKGTQYEEIKDGNLTPEQVVKMEKDIISPRTIQLILADGSMKLIPLDYDSNGEIVINGNKKVIYKGKFGAEGVNVGDIKVISERSSFVMGMVGFCIDIKREKAYLDYGGIYEYDFVTGKISELIPKDPNRGKGFNMPLLVPGTNFIVAVHSNDTFYLRELK